MWDSVSLNIVLCLICASFEIPIVWQGSLQLSNAVQAALALLNKRRNVTQSGTSLSRSTITLQVL